MRILHIVNSLECGGLEKVVIHLAAALKGKGIKTDILCLCQEGDMAPLARAKGVSVFCLGKKDGFSISTVFKLTKKIRQGKYDLVNTHNFAPLIYGSLAARMAGVPCINTRHGSDAQSVHALLWSLNAKVIAVGNYAKEELLRNNRINPRKMVVIYNAVENNEFNNGNEIRKIKEIVSGHNKFVGIVGRLAFVKDHRTLLQAFKNVLLHHPDACLSIAGDGPLKDELKQYVLDNGLNDKVFFLGFCQDVQGFLNLLNVFVLSSLNEGISLAILEAMSAAKPVVATRVGGNPEIVEDGVTGFLVASQSSQEMAEKISQLLDDPSLAKTMGEAGSMRAKDNFSINRMLEGYIAVYQEVLKSKGTYGTVHQNIGYHESFS
ncbi:MAG: glycosyltransferase [Candidatus Omnitrophica bacterium]|nr:glycosyltransferase [Candidatus Omnitrophota bacterium]MDE2213823.1 glycosyltransferase [Candidatus Omnitrophota bacterium]